MNYKISSVVGIQTRHNWPPRHVVGQLWSWLQVR